MAARRPVRKPKRARKRARPARAIAAASAAPRAGDKEKEKKKKNVFSRIVAWFKKVAEWVPEHLGDPAIARAIREDLGLKPGEQIPAQKNAKFVQFGAGLDPDKESFAATVAELKEIIQEIKTLAELHETDEMPARQLQYVLLKLAATDSVRQHFPALFALHRALLFFEEDTEALIMIDPARLLRQARGEDLPSGEVLAQRLSGAVALSLQLFDAFFFKGEPTGDAPGHVDILYGWDASPDSETPLIDLVSSRTATWVIGREDGTGGRLLASVAMVAKEHGGPGLFISLGGAITVAQETDEGVRYRLDAGFPNAFDIFIPFGDSPLPLTAQGGGTLPFLKFRIEHGDPDEPAFRIGEPEKTRLDVYETEFGIDVAKDKAGIRVAIRNAELVVAPGEGDGFLRRIAGSGAKLRFSGGFIADSDGFRLDGGTGLSATLPVGRALAGLLTVHHVELALGPSTTGGDLALELGGAFTAKLGPFSAAVDRMGFRLDIDRRDNGNLGPLHFDLGFKPPSGVGLVLDAGFAKGGGYIFRDPARGEYAGALELKIGSLSVKAIGVLTTRPDDWSLLLMLFLGRAGTPVPSPGFMIEGVGGLIGLQHGVELAPLIAGMRTKAFDDILFPADPVADAPRIINRLREIFPARPGSLTIGLMVAVSWAARVVTARLGVIVQIDNVFNSPNSGASFSRAVLIGTLRVALAPTKTDPDRAIVRLNVDVLGFWDRVAKRYGFIARLRDSKIASVDLIGSLAIYGEYGEKQRFILAAGGFNPRFKDVPAEIGGVLDRIGAAFKVGRFSFALTGYFAMTPGTKQGGFDIVVSGKIGPVGIKGGLGFDILYTSEPYEHFITDFRFLAEVSFKGRTLAGVKVVGTIEGPGLWHLVGKVTFSILWWDVSKSFDESWGTAPPAITETTNLAALLGAELARVENWTAQLPTGAEPMVTLAPQQGEPALLAHPLGRFAFSQRVVPLGLTVQRVGSTRVAGPDRFDITRVVIGTAVIPAADRPATREHFARGDFLDMTDEEKLTRPSFEAMESGVEFASEAFRVSPGALTASMDHETAYLDIDERRGTTTTPETRLGASIVEDVVIGALARQGAAGRSALRTQERLRARRASRIDLAAVPLAVADRVTLAADASMSGQARDVAMIAEQRLSAADRRRALLCEAFELAEA